MIAKLTKVFLEAIRVLQEVSRIFNYKQTLYLFHINKNMFTCLSERPIQFASSAFLLIVIYLNNYKYVSKKKHKNP